MKFLTPEGLLALLDMRAGVRPALCQSHARASEPTGELVSINPYEVIPSSC